MVCCRIQTFEGNPRVVDLHVDLGAIEFANRLMPSLKGFKTEIPSKGSNPTGDGYTPKTKSLYRLEQEENQTFYVKYMIFKNNVIRELKMKAMHLKWILTDLKLIFIRYRFLMKKSSHSDRIEIKKALILN